MSHCLVKTVDFVPFLFEALSNLLNFFWREKIPYIFNCVLLLYVLFVHCLNHSIFLMNAVFDFGKILWDFAIVLLPEIVHSRLRFFSICQYGFNCIVHNKIFARI